MDLIVSTWLEMITRWAHVVAGVVWIGFLFYFVLVQLDALSAMGDARREAARQLMPRGLWWFRWMAALTLFTGILLLWLVYYQGGMLYVEDSGTTVTATVTALLSILIAVAAYDTITARIERARFAHPLSVGLLAFTYWILSEVADFNGRSVWIHVGSAMGLALFVNVWFRVWPAVKRGVLPALEAGMPPDPQAMKVIATRARRSIYIAVPLLFLMISNHYPALHGSPLHGAYFTMLVLIGFLVAAAFSRKASSLVLPVPDKIERKGAE